MPGIISILLTYRYLVILPLAIFEGPVLSMISGALLRLGFFSFWPVFICLMIGDFVSDAYWYWIGYHGGRNFLLKYGKYFSVTEDHMDNLETVYQNHYGWILFLSKITMGLGFGVAIVAMAGAAKVPFKKYMTVVILSQPIWTGILMSIGYFLGDFYLRASKGLEFLSVSAIVVIAGAALFGLNRYLRRRIVKKYL